MKKYEKLSYGLLVVLLVVTVVALIYNKKHIRPVVDSPTKQAKLYDADEQKYNWQITDFATNLEVVWDIAFDSANNLYVTERPGRLRVISQAGQEMANISLANVASTGESGLTGVTLDPGFDQNKTIYLYYTYREGGSLNNRVSSFVYQNGSLTNEKYILNALPGGAIHNGGRLRFGPDGKLWVLTGDAARPGFAQDDNSLAGKVLRMNSDGTPPADNPKPGTLIYSKGHRNPQGIAFHSLTEEPIVTEHGETAHDEVNLIKAGANYGWPNEKKCFSSNPELKDPIICSGSETYAPSGITSLSTDIWKFRNSFIFSGLRGNMVARFEVIDGKVASQEVILKGDYGRMRAAAQAPDGTIYVSTSNRDGRGKPAPNDDRILKLTPQLVE